MTPEEWTELRRIVADINRFQAEIKAEREAAGVKPGEPLIGLKL